MMHTLKTEKRYFQRIVDGSKTFELRRNDRDFQSGDTLYLAETVGLVGLATSTGRKVYRRIGYVLSTGEPVGLPLSGFAILSLLPDPDHEDQLHTGEIAK